MPRRKMIKNARNTSLADQESVQTKNDSTGDGLQEFFFPDDEITVRAKNRDEAEKLAEHLVRNKE